MVRVCGKAKSAFRAWLRRILILTCRSRRRSRAGGVWKFRGLSPPVDSNSALRCGEEGGGHLSLSACGLVERLRVLSLAQGRRLLFVAGATMAVW